MGRYTEDFEEKELLGKGGFAVVYQCKHRLDESLYAVKKIPFNDQQLQEKLREVKILAVVQHSRVLRYHQVYLFFSLCTYTL
ncbi:PREDICTED: interferon-induced, double-stranded RNA-activated protein kinase-like [Nicotiana attenuata]|uniref:interferon-induced, double-stranded RNA-activated protein kinase-like n=1 Tax=Nicotiana attenuata TaxID=49451 RepID=UPI0009052FD2|nr:PREDICTED: interferon-induced, double-stranded RNA-activated protein kinase-like [Nicotiana attenuata]